MSYATVVAGLHERFATVTDLVAVLDYVPTAIHDSPLLYSFLDGVKVTRSGQVKATTYRIVHRVVIRWQDNEQAELEMIPFVDAIPNAVDADPHLGGRLVAGFASIDECSAGWDEIAGVIYRVLDFYSTVVEK